ncbi:c-type cytochrome [Azohydromonas caseinilytica]|uniref:Cytochrome c n=1 Tax=Azohydromonas caseinilytica TaxID=2728836 RepID=A0A848FBD2_9BURK|nr:cytochrome c [Azohydromonas caseinilytica]NML16608.1 cytochrome c [Azohydromonas caseinilytica]
MTTLSSTRCRTLAALVLVSGALGGCAQRGTPAAAPPEAATADTAWGRQLFQTHCARCHGEDARGTARAPDLLPRVAGMSEARFTEAVLRRYSWTIAATDAASPDAARQALLGGVLQPRPDPSTMPAWEHDLTVRSGVGQLYRYLDAEARRAQR